MRFGRSLTNAEGAANERHVPLAGIVAAAMLAGCGETDSDPARTVVRTHTVTVPTAASSAQHLSPADNRAVTEAQEVIVAYCNAKAEGLSPRSAGLDSSLRTISDLYRRGPIERWVPPERPERDRTMAAVMTEMVELLRLRGCSPRHADQLAEVVRTTKGVGG